MSAQSVAAVTVELSIEALLGIVELTRSALTEAQYAALKAAIMKLAKVVSLLQTSKASIKRLRRLFFKGSEGTSKVLGNGKQQEPQKNKAPEVDGAVTGRSQAPEPDKRKSNEGRYSTADYTGAIHVPVPNSLLQQKGPSLCPCCEELARFHKSKIVMHLHMTGAPPVQGTVYELEQARCSECGSVITADPPSGAEDKFHNSAIASVVLTHYDAGMPFYTIEQLQDGFGIPLPAGTQWGLVESAVPVFRAVHNVLGRQAADGSLFYTDDTVMKILQYLQKDREDALKPFEKDPAKRTGMFTTGIVSVCGTNFIVLYFTGARHAGENLTWLLLQRDETLSAPMLMCDGAHRNVPCLPGRPEAQKRLNTVDLQCNAHARRNFLDVFDDFPKQVETVLRALERVYATDAKAKKEGLSPAARLKLHQDESGPVMKELKEWMDRLVAQKLVEPNSGLGGAINYMTQRWEALTRFLHVESAPLDNNAVERALKKVIRLRKRSMFYMNARGAAVGDLCLSLIETAKQNGVKPFAYLLALLNNGEAVLERPWEWLPWNYMRALERLSTVGPEPPTPAVVAAAA
jgi:transposase